MVRAPTFTKRSLLVIAALLGCVLAVVETAIWLRMGSPPPYDMVLRLNECALQSNGTLATLHCESNQQEPISVPVQSNRYRVVVFGDSSARRPAGGNVADALQDMLPNVDVINFAVDGLPMANIAKLIKQSAVLDPDMVVLFAGHADYSDDAFYGRVQGAHLWLAPVYGALARSWIHALVMRPPQFLPRVTGGTSQVMVPTEEDVALQQREAVNDRFRSDLELAISVSPAPMVLSTLLRNPETPPTGVLVGDMPVCRRVAHQLQHSNEDELRQALLTAETYCGEGAITWWLRGRLAMQEGRNGDAIVGFRNALELDPLPTRAPMVADGIIRDVANSHQIMLIDPAVELGALPPTTLFDGPVHLSEQGAREVAFMIKPSVSGLLARN